MRAEEIMQSPDSEDWRELPKRSSGADGKIGPLKLRGECLKSQPRLDLEIRGKRLPVAQENNNETRRIKSGTARKNLEGARDLAVEEIVRNVKVEIASLIGTKNEPAFRCQSRVTTGDETTKCQPRKDTQSVKTGVERETLNSAHPRLERSYWEERRSSRVSRKTAGKSPNWASEGWQTSRSSFLSRQNSQGGWQQIRWRSLPDIAYSSRELKFGVQNSTRRSVSCKSSWRQDLKWAAGKTSVKGHAGLEPILGREEPSKNLHAELGNEWHRMPLVFVLLM